MDLAVTNMSTVHDKVVQYRSSMVLSTLLLYFVRTTDLCEETNICIYRIPQ